MNALELCLTVGSPPPPWYLPSDRPACADIIIDIQPGGGRRWWVCDRPAGHRPGDLHRQVVNNSTGAVITWADTDHNLFDDNDIDDDLRRPPRRPETVIRNRELLG